MYVKPSWLHRLICQPINIYIYTHTTANCVVSSRRHSLVTAVSDIKYGRNVPSTLFNLSPGKLWLPIQLWIHDQTPHSCICLKQTILNNWVSALIAGKRPVATLRELQASLADMKETVFTTTSAAAAVQQSSKERATVERNHMAFRLVFAGGQT